MTQTNDNHDNFDPCPFCLSTHIHHEGVHGARYARCQSCSSSGGYVFDFEIERGVPYTRQTVVDRWNRRNDATLQSKQSKNLGD